MATLFRWQFPGGLVRSCNANCHNAENLKCTCICGGKYHGCAHELGGVDHARKDVQANIAAWQEEEARAAAEQQRDEVQPQDLQLSLFDGR